MPDDLNLAVVQDFGTALLLGALVGIEREKHKVAAGRGPAGLRTFVLVSQFGAVAGFLSQQFASPWILAAALLAITALAVASYFAHARVDPNGLGLTTESRR